ncbi:MAG: 5-bromo-4-chloroindolyl phosphate hydrolysis family protein [Oscillospiraceae bacterium]|nr:5-bromo-4-chloroindolyl phosphate hydrolysis family protein [Oscillospiraceae bacterium]
MSEWRYDESSGSFRQYNNSPKKDDSDWFSWVLIGLLFVSGWGWWIGLILLINKLKDDKRRPAQRSTAHSASSTAQQTAKPAASKAAKAAKKVTKSPSDTSKTAKILQIVGAAVMGLFGIGLLSELGNLVGGYWVDWESVLTLTGFVAGGATTFFYGRKMQKRQNRLKRYMAVLGERDHVTVAELCAIVGKKEKVVKDDVEYMLQKNMLATGAFLDEGRGILFRSADAYQRYLTERTKKENLTPKEATEGYSGALRAIREANDRIPDPVFSEKLDRMETVAGKIFREVEDHPEKLKQASTFFDYYLPTTLKLLSTYSEFEEAGIEGENLRSAKARIESIMDNLLENFEKQLDELYRSEALDVDADIRVMESMLNRDLSSVERDFGLGGTAVVQRPEDME